MTGEPADWIDSLSDHDAEQLLHAVTDRLVEQAGGLVAENEDEAREIIAASVTRYTDGALEVDAVAPATAEPIRMVRGVLSIMALDPEVGDLVRETATLLPEETQMFVEPISAALALAGIVAFLQTKFSLRVRRTGGHIDVDLSVSKDATSEDLIKQTLAAAASVSGRT